MSCIPYLCYCFCFSALKPIRPPNLNVQSTENQQGLSSSSSGQSLGSARPVDLGFSVNPKAGLDNSNSDFFGPVQQPILNRGHLLRPSIKSGPTVRPTAPPVRYVTSQYLIFKLSSGSNMLTFYRWI